MVSKTEETQLSNLESQGDNGGGGAWEYLCLVRKLKVRHSEKVLKHGLSILNDPKKRSSLGSDGEFRASLLFSRNGFVWILVIGSLILIGHGLELCWIVKLFGFLNWVFSFLFIHLDCVSYAVLFLFCKICLLI
jgi:hypothetical protein